jgi:glycosyltransferase involved in cell wall biosynthesis
MNGASWGGSEELWYKTAKHALDKGSRVGVVTYQWPSKLKRIEALAQSGAIIYNLPNKGVEKRNFKERILYKFTKKILLKKYINSIPTADYDIVVINLGAFEMINKVWKGFYKQLKRYVLLFHNYNDQEGFSSSKASAMIQWIQNAQLNLFASSRIQAMLERTLGIAITNGGILLNPITFYPPENRSVDPALKDGFYKWTMLAALEVYRKGQDKLVETLSSEKWKQRNWVLELYGEGKDQEMLEQLIISNGLSGRIILKGQTNNVKQVLYESHLVLQITNLDAMPLAVVEAMAMSRPLVVSDIGDMPYWVLEEENGWVSANTSVEEIDRTLEKAWKGKERWNAMGKKSFEIFNKKFSGSPEMQLWDQLSNI